MEKISGLLSQLFSGKEDISWIPIDEKTEYRKGNSYLCKSCHTPTACEIKNNSGIIFTQRVTCKCRAGKQEQNRRGKKLWPNNRGARS